MKRKYYFFTFFFILSLHFLILFLSPQTSLIQKEKHCAKVKEVFLPKKPKPLIVNKPKPIKKLSSTKKKPSSVKKEGKKTQQKELTNILHSWDKIFSEEKTEDFSCDELFIPPKIQIVTDQTSFSQDNKFALEVLSLIEKNITLPEKGNLQVELTFTSSGKLQSYTITNASSTKNVSYLKKRLPNLQFPCFNGEEKKTVKLNVIAN